MICGVPPLSDFNLSCKDVKPVIESVYINNEFILIGDEKGRIDEIYEKDGITTVKFTYLSKNEWIDGQSSMIKFLGEIPTE